MLTRFASLAAVILASDCAPPGNFLPQCTSENDYGWPRFQSRKELEADSKWATYFNKVYGELPTDYPVCVYDFWYIDKASYIAAGLNGTRAFVDSKTVKEGDLFRQGGMSGESYQIYHSKWEPIPNNTWIEVTHSVFPTEMKGAWIWNQRGSGIWYNVGKTKVFPTPREQMLTHHAAIVWLKDGCTVPVSKDWPQQESDIFGLCARQKGIDSIQFEPQDGQSPIGTFGQTGLMEAVLVGIDGDKTCGVENATATPLRSGWMASHQCNCHNEPIADSCGLMPEPPLSVRLMGGDKPPLCKLRAESQKNKCNPLTCGTFHCKL